MRRGRRGGRCDFGGVSFTDVVIVFSGSHN